MNTIYQKSKEKSNALIEKILMIGGISAVLIFIGVVGTLIYTSRHQNTPAASIPPVAIVQEYHPTQSQDVFVQPTSTLEQMIELTPTAYIQQSTPLREQKTKSIGTGALANASYSDGLAPYSEDWLWANNHHKIQRIRKEEQPSGCDIAQYDAKELWIASSQAVDFLVNDQSIGHLNKDTGSVGYLIDYPISKGDKLCISKVPSNGFHIVLGPDIHWAYDSYCYRLSKLGMPCSLK